MDNLENYKKEKITINIIKANILVVLMIIPTFLIFGLPYYLIWGYKIIIPSHSQLIGEIIIFFIAMIIGIIIHELIHGLVWAKYAKHGLHSIKFGVIWKLLTPYCHCKEPLSVKHYILGLIMPAIVLGILPSLIAIIIGNIPILLFGMVFTLCAGGDFLVINLLRKEDKNDFAEDHPSEAGCYVYRKINN